MVKRAKTVRLSETGEAELRALAGKLRLSEARVVEEAVRRMAVQELGERAVVVRPPVAPSPAEQGSPPNGKPPARKRPEERKDAGSLVVTRPDGSIDKLASQRAQRERGGA
jgi:hypothetical protein